MLIFPKQYLWILIFMNGCRWQLAADLVNFGGWLKNMNTKGQGKNNVNIVTLGCAKNIVDSEILLTQLKGNNEDVRHESQKDDANIVVINTCGFIDSAKQESIDTILRYVDAKQNGLIEKLYVTGCLSQRYKEDLRKEIPDVDAWFGTNELPQLLNRFNVDYKHELVGEWQITTPRHYAYLKISEGCDRPCAFCAIPLMRGRHVSKPMDALITVASNLARSGVKELLLLAQDTTYYGIDLYGKRSLAELLRKLSDVEGLEWIRLHYAFPTGFPLEVLDVISEKDNICNYLDIPLQHASTRMLKIMRRGTTRKKTETLLHTIRDRVPDIALRTTLITGHPGETEEDFEQMMDFVLKSRFDRLGVFTYSHEENTHAFSLEVNVSEELKQKRVEDVMELQQCISFEINTSKVGRVMKVLTDRVEAGNLNGRREFDSPEVDNEVIIENNQNLNNDAKPGEFIQVKITDANEFDLFGKILSR